MTKRKRSMLKSLACVFISIVMMLVTLPLARVYCGLDFAFYVYLFFIVWLFVAVPIIFLYLEKRNRCQK